MCCFCENRTWTDLCVLIFASHHNKKSPLFYCDFFSHILINTLEVSWTPISLNLQTNLSYRKTADAETARRRARRSAHWRRRSRRRSRRRRVATKTTKRKTRKKRRTKKKRKTRSLRWRLSMLQRSRRSTTPTTSSSRGSLRRSR